MSGFKSRSVAQQRGRRTWIALCTIGCCLLLLLAHGPASAAPVLVSFEPGEGYGAPGTSLNSAGPFGPTTLWTNVALNNFFVADATAPDSVTNPGAALTGVQYAHSQSTGNGEEILRMDLDVTQNLSLTSWNYANRGSFAPHARIDYYDIAGNLIGTNSYTNPVDGTGPGTGLAPNFDPEWDLLTPTAPFQNVPLSRIDFRSRQYNQDDTVVGLGSAFYIEDILLESNSTGSYDNSQVVVSFEPGELGSNMPTNHGSLIEDGAVSWPGFIDAMNVLIGPGNADDMFVHHGFQGPQIPGAGRGAPDMEEPISGSQMAYYEANAQEELEIDMNVGSNHGLESLWYQYRGGGGATGFVQLDFYGPDDMTLLGSHTVSTSDDGGVSIGLDGAWTPEFDLITVPAALASQAMGRIVLHSKNTLGGHATFAIDHLTFNNAIPEPTSFALLALAGVALACCRRRQG